MARSVRRYAIIGAVVVVLLGLGVFVGIRLLRSSVNDAIPQADLFGSETPTPAGTTGSPTPTAGATTPPGSTIKGPLNILISGVDTREYIKNWICLLYTSPSPRD